MDVRFVDTSFRDGAQSLWALGIRGGMIDSVAENMDAAGFHAIEVLCGAVFQKKFVRDQKENPWDLMRLMGRKMPKTTKTTMAVGNVLAFERSPHALYELFYKRIISTGTLDRVQVMANTADELTRDYPFVVPFFQGMGVKFAAALCYTISPRHTDAYFAETTRRIVAFKPDVIYIKDAGGLLTVDRLRTLVPAVIEAAGGIPLELHSHCTTGLAPLVYLEALKLGISTLHTAVPPLANGSSQPSVFNIASNARLLGHSVTLDTDSLGPVSKRLTDMARLEGLPIGAPLEYDYSQYIHQVPGGVISNLMHQLKGLRLEHRLDEVLAESVHVRKDLGYPMMITPHSQYVVSQAAINVATGARYKLTIDELVRFAQGMYGEDSGYQSMDPNLKDRLLGSDRAREMGAVPQGEEVTLADLRARFGGPGVDDEEFLLRYIMKSSEEIAAMRAAGPPRQYYDSSQSLLTLVQELSKRPKTRYVHIERNGTSVLLRNRAPAPAAQ